LYAAVIIVQDGRNGRNPHTVIDTVDRSAALAMIDVFGTPLAPASHVAEF
jgi:hypothetical protein